jgi:hypothetical protein
METASSKKVDEWNKKVKEDRIGSQIGSPDLIPQCLNNAIKSVHVASRTFVLMIGSMFNKKQAVSYRPLPRSI